MSIFYRETLQPDYYDGDVLRQRNEIRRNLLNLNNRLKEQMESLQIDFGHMQPSVVVLKQQILQILENVLINIENLNLLTDGRYQSLYTVHKDIENEVLKYMQSIRSNQDQLFSVSLSEQDSSEPDYIEEKDDNWIARSRRQRLKERKEKMIEKYAQVDLLLTGGVTIFPGWAIGQVYIPESNDDILESPSGAILVVKQIYPEIMEVLPHLSGLIAEHEDSSGHVAAKVQELGLPCLFCVESVTDKLENYTNIILDAGQRKIFIAPISPLQKKETKKIEIRHISEQKDPIFNLLFKSNLSDPVRESPEECKSLADLICFIRDKTAKNRVPLR